MLLALKRCCFILYKNLAFFPPLTATLRRFTLVPFFFLAILAIGPSSQLFHKPNVGDDMPTTPSIPDPTLAPHPSSDYCLATATITVALLFQLLLLPPTPHFPPPANIEGAMSMAKSVFPSHFKIFFTLFLFLFTLLVYFHYYYFNFN